MKLLLLPTLSLVALAAQAQAQTASRIDQVTVYPGLAAVERSAKVAAGARELVLNCLSPNFDMGSLRVEADAGIRLGPVSASNRPRAEVAACSDSPLDGRIRALEDKLAALQAESSSQELVLGYLRVLGPAEPASAPRQPLPAGGLPATLGAIQRAGQQALSEQNRLAREREAVERELRPLKSERDRLGLQQGEVRELRIALTASREGAVRLSYQVPGPTWAPGYRAVLDFDGKQVDIERLAQVSQRSGEDWMGVALRLSTGSPRSATSGPQPRRWQVTPLPAAAPSAPPPPPPPVAARAFRAAPMAAKAEAEPELDFAVQVSQGEFATEFVVPGTVDVGSGAQRVNLSLGSLRVPVDVKVQTTPAADASAWLVAAMAVPPGVWPDGPLQLLRGTQVVGSSTWRVGQRDRITLPFGRDEQVRVQVVPGQAKTGSTGFIATRTERRISQAYVVENRRRSPIDLEVLEASPMPSDEQITVTRQFEPAVLPGFWQEQPGIVVWQQKLAPGQSARFSAEYVISSPKDLPIRDIR
jgi:uncharacterized protein (TIGR02231 family)